MLPGAQRVQAVTPKTRWDGFKKKNKEVQRYVTNYLLIAAFDVWVIANELCAAVSSQRKDVGEVRIDTLQAFGIQH